MQIIDLHCDVLWRLTTLEQLNFRNDARLHCNLERLQQGGVKAQVFAIFIPPSIPQSQKFFEVIKQIEAFHTQVLREPEMVHITEWSQLAQLELHEIGAILSLEGCDSIGDDLVKLETVLAAGVKIVGLTWNDENAVAYGAEQHATLGLKPFGDQVIDLLNARNIIIDVSHLNEQSFWDVLPRAKHVLASHSNARALCDHPRNLSDEQLRALVDKGGHIHVVFYPAFLAQGAGNVGIEQVVEHIRYLTDLVGVEKIGFGSDFDGIEFTVQHLAHAGQFLNLITMLQNEFTKQQVTAMAANNFHNFIARI